MMKIFGKVTVSLIGAKCKEMSDKIRLAENQKSVFLTLFVTAL